jgi:hypothetical protein
MEKTHITTKGDAHRKSTNPAGKGEGTATTTTMEGEIKYPWVTTKGTRKVMKTESFRQETIGERRNQGTWVPQQKICYIVLVASITHTWTGKESPTTR